MLCTNVHTSQQILLSYMKFHVILHGCWQRLHFIIVSVLFPCTGIEKRKENDTFNHYLSHLRIKIQLVFGLLVNKRRIFLKNNIEINLTWIPFLIECCFQLHNICCINERKRVVCLWDSPWSNWNTSCIIWEEYLDELDNDGQQLAGGCVNIWSKIKHNENFLVETDLAYNIKCNYET